MAERPYAVVSCHVEAPLDDRCWRLFSQLQSRTPGGFRIAALLRPPDRRAGEDEGPWLERARAAAGRGPLGHHTHFVSPTHARPHAAGPEHAERVRAEAAWLRERGVEAELFCGGGWYIDDDVARAVAELGYADCTATAFRPAYLAEGAPRLEGSEPGWIEVAGARLLELPTTHSLGMALRGAFSPLPRYVHLYFHDTDLLSLQRRTALLLALAVLSRRRQPRDLAQLKASAL
jgi:hypothetical protein